jgi:hypothetical protein
MSDKLIFKVESLGKPYAVMVLSRGTVTARIGRLVLRGAMLAYALQWVKDRNPHPATEPHVTLVGRYT